MTNEQMRDLMKIVARLTLAERLNLAANTLLLSMFERGPDNDMIRVAMDTGDGGTAWMVMATGEDAKKLAAACEAIEADEGETQVEIIASHTTPLN